MITDFSHMPAIHVASYTIAGGNGLNEMDVLTTDPLQWVQDQIALRAPEPAPNLVATHSIGTVDPSGQTTSAVGHALGVDSLKQWGTGLMIALVVALLGIVLVALGVFQLSKE